MLIPFHLISGRMLYFHNQQKCSSSVLMQNNIYFCCFSWFYFHFRRQKLMFGELMFECLLCSFEEVDTSQFINKGGRPENSERSCVFSELVRDLLELYFLLSFQLKCLFSQILVNLSRLRAKNFLFSRNNFYLSFHPPSGVLKNRSSRQPTVSISF